MQAEIQPFERRAFTRNVKLFFYRFRLRKILCFCVLKIFYTLRAFVTARAKTVCTRQRKMSSLFLEYPCI